MGITRIFQATVPRTSTCAGKYDIAPQASYLNLIEQDEFHCEIREPNSPSKNKKKKKKKTVEEKEKSPWVWNMDSSAYLSRSPQIY